MDFQWQLLLYNFVVYINIVTGSSNALLTKTNILLHW